MKPDIVLALITENNLLLTLEHNEIGKITLPMGKVEPGEMWSQALVREMYEELDIHVSSFRLITTIDVELYNELRHIKIYKVLHYLGTPINKELQKHRSLLKLSATDMYKYQKTKELDIVILKCMELNIIDSLFMAASEK